MRVPAEVAIVGCGRWGKTLCRVLIESFPSIATIHLVAQRNTEEVVAWRHGQRADAPDRRHDRVRVTADLREILANDRVEAAFVTKMAAEHYRATKQLLEAGKHVFVEKPFVLRTEQARELVRLADERRRTLVVGYEYLLAPFLRAFADRVKRQLPDVREVHVAWEESPQAVTSGIPKHTDWSSNIVTNLYPHALSQLMALLGDHPIAVDAIESTDPYRQATIRMRYGAVPVTARLNKAGAHSCRRIEVVSSAGERMALDYTQEPGTITLNGAPLAPDPRAEALPRPLPYEIARFFAQIDTPQPDLATLAKNSMPIVEATEAANERLEEAQTQALRQQFLRDLPERVPDSALRILHHHLVMPLLEHGLLANPKDERALTFWSGQALRIAHAFSQAPWTTQAEILEHTGLAKRQLLALNAAVRDVPLLQRLIIREGIGQKYWASILPLVRSGALGAVLTNSYRFPLRTGIYAGVSCMFFCSFCGRNPKARYRWQSAQHGNAMFERIFAGVPQDGEYTFSFSGGLEPLTNPGFGELVRSAKRHGIRVPLITNAFMLSPQYVAKQEGTWDLDSLRVSLYGVDEASYVRVTRLQGAFGQVKANLISFLRLRNARGSPLKVGLNFIILRGGTDQVLRVLDLVADINTAVGGHGIDFLSLREDFSVPEPDGLLPEERAQLIDVFRTFHRRLQTEPALSALEVDLGYALMMLSEGVLGRSLAMVTHQQMRPKAYPQISVVVDLYGDVYLYREAGFLDRPGADRYKIGQVTDEGSLETVIRDFVERGEPIPALPGDPPLLDAYDHIVTMVLNQAEADAAIGIPFNEGPVLARVDPPAPATARPRRAAVGVDTA